MATTHLAHARVTATYRACCEHLNDHRPLGFSFKEVAGGRQHLDGDNLTRYLWLTTSRPVTQDEMRAALYIYERDCACARDCCGHYTGGPRAHYLRPLRRLRGGRARHWLVPVHYSPNL